MSLEYKDRGVLHKLTRHTSFKPQQSKRRLIRWTGKAILAAETAALFAKDLAVNRFVGKETHIRFERRQSKNGKYRTHIKLVRAEASEKPGGLLHKAFGIGRFFEGDVPFRKKPKLKYDRYKPKTFKGKAAYGTFSVVKVTAGFTFKKGAKLTKAALLTSETAAIKAGSAGIDHLRRKLRDSSSTQDSGKAVLAGITAVQTLNSGRKYLINYRRKRAVYKLKKATYKSHKQQLKAEKKKRTSSKQSVKLKKAELKGKLKSLQKVSVTHIRIKVIFKRNEKSAVVLKQQLQIKKKRIVIKRKISHQQKLYKIEKAKYRNQKKQTAFAKEEMKNSKIVPIAAIPLVPSAAMTKRLASTYARKIVIADQDNDFVQAADKIIRGTQKINKTAKSVNNKLKSKKAVKTNNKLHSEKNKLHQKTKPKRNRKRKKPKNQKFSQRAMAATKRTAKEAKKVIGDFAKFAIRLLGFLFAPVIAVIFVFIVLIMMFTGTSGNSSYILGTYNAQDRYLAWACEHYTRIAYNFNESLMMLKTDDWKQGLERLGVDTDFYDNKPDKLIFGKSSEFNNSVSVYDYDDDRFASFLCAYYYEPEENTEETQYWSWNSDAEVDAVLQSLFDAEYSFKHKYDNYSRWKEYQDYDTFGGGGTSFAYYSVYTDGLTKNRMKVKIIPDEIRTFCKDGYLHYDIDTLEVLDANHDDNRTGYFIQDQRYEVVDPNKNKTSPFYTIMRVKHSEIERYIDDNGMIHFRKSGNETALLDSANGKETGYFIADINSRPFTYYRYVWVHGKNSDGIPLYENRTGYSWNDGKQIFYLVSPSDTKKWNSSLENVCLISFYRKNYWYDDCSLYYTVESKCNFDTAAETVLKTLPDSEDRISFYHLLADGDESYSTCPYGFHQCMSAPLGDKTLQKLIDNGKIYNRFGYNVKEWNKKDCVGLDDCHKGLDILAHDGDEVYAIMSGYVEWVDESKNSISIRNDSWSYWYDGNKERATAVKYNNIKTNLKKGDTVKSGDLIGTVTNKKHCYDNWNSKAEKTYLHIEVSIHYESISHLIFFKEEKWYEVNPLYLLYRGKSENGEGGW